MRFFLFLFLASCANQITQVQPALDTAQLLQDQFDADQRNVRGYIASSNPDPAQFQAFTNAQDESRATFLKIYRAHVAHLMSLGQFDVEAVNQTLEQITEMIENGKR